MNFMNTNTLTTGPVVIGIDHGYGNIKTAHCCFKSGVTAYDKEPTFKSNLLIYEGTYYIIGEEHKEFISDKMTDSEQPAGQCAFGVWQLTTTLTGHTARCCS